MKFYLYLFYYASLFFIVTERSYAKNAPPFSASQLFFIENNGQVKDQFNNPRGDINFALQAHGVNIFIGAGKLHYQFSKIEKQILNVHDRMYAHTQDSLAAGKTNEPEGSFSLYRMDVELIGANNNALVIAEDKQAYYENYYLPGCPAEGIQAHAYKKITYRDIYPGIDWVIYLSGNTLKHEFVVGPHADASMVKLKYGGCTSLKLNDDGSISAITPFGAVREEAPVCRNAAGNVIPSAYQLSGDVLTYDLDGYEGQMVIDPVLEWGTYYGPDSTTTKFYTIAVDDSANIYGCGLTWADNAATIVTSGSYQAAFGGGGTDAFLVKFDSAGNREWATYYGGNDADWAIGVACDVHGNVYMSGVTASTSGIATASSQQPVFGGGAYDGFLVKFTSAGNRIWSTYVGGAGVNYPWSVFCDLLGHVFVAGDTNEPDNIATPTGANPAKSGGFDNYVVQYDSAGTRTWGTYYGGSGNEFGGVACVNTGNFVHLAGWTPSTSGIATALTQQPVFGGGGTDAYLAKFSDNGTLLWATYYGGTSGESVGGVVCDKAGFVYLLGSTSSDDAIASPGCFQPARGVSSTDAFLAKFEPELGYRVWGTYYGGPGTENVDQSRMASDDSNFIYICGYTNSTTGVASDTAWQTTYGGGDADAFLAKFSNLGQRIWSTYYGGGRWDMARGCATDGKGVYICGETSSAEQIATPGGYLPTGGGSDSYSQGFIAKFVYPDTTTPADTSVAVHTVKQIPAADFIIYPNPNNGSFTLHGSFGATDGTAQLTVTDATGRVIWRDEVAVVNGKINKQLKLNSKTPPGAYFLKITVHDKADVLRFLKE